ncbi:MAG: DUF4129 domain-containing protein [Bryobacteraceae bacterium]
MRALDRWEEALQLLRRQLAGSWMRYLFGAIPFLLILLYFVRDMASGLAAERCLLESLLCVLAFFWHCYWKARFAGGLASALEREAAEAEHSAVAQCLFVQMVLQSLKLFVLPLALIAVAPSVWTCAFFRSAAIEADRPGCTLRTVVRRSANQASSFPRTNWLALLLTMVMGAVVFIDLLILILLLPQLTKIFTGYENEWTRNAGHLLSFNLVAAAVALAWFLMDPMLQAYFVVNRFHSVARRDGRDLLVRLRRMAALLPIVLAIGMIMIPAECTASAPTEPRASARGAADPSLTVGVPLGARTISKQDLDKAVAATLRRGEFGWERAHHTSGIGDSFFGRLSREARAVLHRAGAWIAKIIRRLFGHNPAQKKQKPPQNHPRPEWWMYAIGGILLLAVAAALFRMRTRRAAVSEPPTVEAKQPDATDEQMLATDVPEHEWLRLAREYRSKGEIRLAVRAMYLSNLAYLGARQLIAVQKSKTNGVYERELFLRAREGALMASFSSANRIYERAWYGFHEVTAESIEQFENGVQVIHRYAET